MRALAIVNAVLALSGTGFGVVALVAPRRMSGERTSSRYFARMYAARAIPFGIALAIVLIADPAAARLWLVAGGVIQAFDSFIGFTRPKAPPAAFAIPAVIAAVHFWSAVVL